MRGKMVMRKQRISTKYILLLLAIIIVAGVVVLLLWPESEPEAMEVIETTAAGYQSLMEVDGVLYLVDLNGNIMTMDWYTGETELFCKAPGLGGWIADRDMSHLYYMEQEMLCQKNTNSGKTEEIGPLSGEITLLEVTEHCIFYRTFIWEGMECKDLYYALELSTGESRLMFADQVVKFTCLPGPGDTLYVGLNFSDSKDRVEKWDLSTGEKSVVLEHMNNITLPQQGAVLGNTLYLHLGNTVCTMPADGSGEPAVLQVRPGNASYLFHCKDDTLVYQEFTDEKVVIYRYDPKSGVSTELPNWEFSGASHVAMSSDRYAIMSNFSAPGKLVIADLP